jgi:2-polyprenyl-3-methyl-5-hydroxy-6-metoxy-1,4-benzoquinol methylase
MQNPAFQDKDSEYYTREKSWMVPLVKRGPNVILDLGCASGRLGKRLLADGKAKELIGAEIFAPAAEEAAKIYKKVYVGDVEEIDLEYSDYFDYVICGDILEHLKDPYRVVERISTWLKPGGSLLACVPNVRNFRVLRNLIFRGEWNYVSSGILDRTHLRFFTRSSCRRMLADVGLDVYHEKMIIYGTKKTIFDTVTLGCFAEFLATQVFCCARKPERIPRDEPGLKHRAGQGHLVETS